MNPTTFSKKFLAALALPLLAAPVHAGILYTSGVVNTEIPDDDDTGLTSTLSVPVGETGWSGDLYIYLQHDSEMSVLLNRPGSSSTNPFGYNDSQPITLTLTDTGANGDLHTYRASESVALTGPLTGSWQPDGRSSDPATVVTSDLRNAMLDQFHNLNSTGNWTLFVADLAGGGRYQLDSWSVAIAPVPEPATTAVTAGLLLGGWAAWRRRGQKAQK
jgi:hypothetical protein